MIGRSIRYAEEKNRAHSYCSIATPACRVMGVRDWRAGRY